MGLQDTPSRFDGWAIFKEGRSTRGGFNSMPAEPPPPPKVSVYVDAFNLYYCALRFTPYKWLNLDALCRAALPGKDIQKIRVFSANVSATSTDPGITIRQQTYFRALKTIPNLELHLGTFLKSEIWAPLVNAFPPGAVTFWNEGDPPPASKTDPVIGVSSNGTQMARVHKREEKGSDVNIASFLLIDAFTNQFDEAVVISNDSDLKTPIEYVVKAMGKPVTVVHPCRPASPGHKATHPGRELRSIATASIVITDAMLSASQFPPSMTDANGTITKPQTW
jgi:hypothetical protein